MKHLIKNLPSEVKKSFELAWNGKEELEVVIWIWGGGAYLLSLLINRIILWNKFYIIDALLSLVVIAYFVGHIVAIRRCAPKKKPLTKEEKEQLKKDRVKRFFRKLLLQEPISKWNPVAVVIAIDLYVIVYFLEYIIK